MRLPRWLLGFLPLIAAAVAWAETGIDIGSRRELFVDHHLTQRLEGARLRLHHPRREGTALVFDKPWEGLYSAYITVFRDKDRCRMYYRGQPELAGATQVTCYAESKDGIHWTKPSLGLHEVRGTKNNNVILAGEPDLCHNFAPFIDTKPGVPAQQRYKALAGTRKTGLVAFASADAVRWKRLRKEPVITKGAFDSQNVAFWSDAEGCYVCCFRTWKKVGGTSYRWISRTTSKDFLNWTEPVEMTFGDAPPEHLYTNGTLPYFRAPHIYVALAKRFFPGKVALPPDEAAALVPHPRHRIASSDAVLMTSRGGGRYDRTFLEAFIRPGPTPRDWICRDNTPAWGIVPTTDRRMFLYRLSHYAQPTSHVTRYSLRLDGFVSVSAPLKGGELVTRPLRFEGRELAINFETSAAGGIRVEIQGADGEPVEGFALADCPLIFGDAIDRAVTWKGGSNVGRLAGRPVRLRFVLKDADLYALRFR